MKKANLTKQAIKLINEILSTGITIPELCKALGYSRSWLANALKPIDYNTYMLVQSNKARDKKISNVNETIKILKEELKK